MGVDVYTADLHRLGIVNYADAGTLLVEEGLFVQYTYTLNPSDVDRYEDGELLLKLTMEQVTAAGREG